MKFSKFMIKRYLRFDKSQPFISVTAILSFLGVMVGVMVLIIAMSIMNGMSKEFQKRLFTMNYPLTIYPMLYSNLDDKLIDELKSNFDNLKFSPFIKSQVVIKRGDKFSGGILFGVDFEKEAKINEILAKAIEPSIYSQKFPLIVGSGLYRDLNLKEGERVTLMFTEFNPSGLSILPKLKRFELNSKFESGLIAYDKSYLYTDLDSIKKVLSKESYSGVHIYSNKPFKDITKLRDFLRDRAYVIGWWEQNGNFFAAFETEKKALFIVLMLIVLVASLNIISSLLMLVMSRRSEIALMLSLGSSKSEIKNLFLKLGVVVGGSGVIFGVIFGFLGMFILSSTDLITIPADVYGTSNLPIDLATFDFISIVIGSLIMVTLSSYYPAKKASEIDILNVLRSE